MRLKFIVIAMKIILTKIQEIRSLKKNLKAAEAYEILSDSQEKAQYDQFGHQALSAEQGFGGFGNANDIFEQFSFSGDLGDIFSEMFNGGRRRSGPVRGAHLRYVLEVDFEEAVLGSSRTLTLNEKIIISKK